MPTKRTVDFNGKKVEGEVVDFKQQTMEAWNEYAFSDGTTVKLKVVLLDVVRLIGEYGPNGDPVYVFSAQQIANVQPPENLKQRKQ